MQTKIDSAIEKMTLGQLNDLHRGLPALIAKRKAEAAAALRAEMEKVANRSGYTLADVVGVKPAKKAKRKKKLHPMVDGNGICWAGAGRKPAGFDVSTATVLTADRIANDAISIIDRELGRTGKKARNTSIISMRHSADGG